MPPTKFRILYCLCGEKSRAGAQPNSQWAMDICSCRSSLCELFFIIAYLPEKGKGGYECVEVACLPQEELEEYYLDKMDAIYIYEFVPIEEVENLINKHNDKVIH